MLQSGHADHMTITCKSHDSLNSIEHKEGWSIRCANLQHWRFNDSLESISITSDSGLATIGALQ